MSFKLSDFNEKTQAQIRRQLAATAFVGGQPPGGPEPARRRETEVGRVEAATPGLEYRVMLVQFRHRLLDAHDSLPFSVKPLVDEVTRFLGFASDNDPRLHWEYAQVRTAGREGVQVIIQPMA